MWVAGLHARALCLALSKATLGGMEDGACRDSSPLNHNHVRTRAIQRNERNRPSAPMRAAGAPS